MNLNLSSADNTTLLMILAPLLEPCSGFLTQPHGSLDT
jgi:hypothetical protein